jgi:hypothetical protein
MTDMNETLTKAERSELRSLIRRRALVAKKDIDARKASLLADFEEQLTEEFRPEDERWAEVTRSCHREVEEANRELGEVFDRLGIREDIRPQIGWQWLNRPDLELRKAMLRRAAAKRAEAMCEQAKLSIDREAVLIEGRLAATALQSAEAAEWLASLPQVDQLVSALDMASVRAELESGRKP